MAQAKTKTLSLGKHWNNFIESHVGKGRYATASGLSQAHQILRRRRSIKFVPLNPTF